MQGAQRESRKVEMGEALQQRIGRAFECGEEAEEIDSSESPAWKRMISSVSSGRTGRMWTGRPSASTESQSHCAGAPGGVAAFGSPSDARAFAALP
jgi:hypothetical protein